MKTKYVVIAILALLTITVSVFSLKHSENTQILPKLANITNGNLQNITNRQYSIYADSFFKEKVITNIVNPFLSNINDVKVRSLLSILTNAPPGIVLSNNNYSVKLYDLMYLIGNIAATNDTAFSFLKEGINPEFWQAHRTWKWDTSDENENNSMAGISISCLGVSCRKEVNGILENMMNNAELKYLARHSGGIIDAHYYMTMIRELGRENYNKLDGDQRMSKFREWKKTPEGIKLSSWRQGIDSKWMEQKNLQSNPQ
jgi:hypothetical protein